MWLQSIGDLKATAPRSQEGAVGENVLQLAHEGFFVQPGEKPSSSEIWIST